MSRRTRRPRRHAALVGLALLALLAGACASAEGEVTAEEPLLVAGAADLMPAFNALGEDFEAATGEEVTFNFGSSGQLAQQLIEGAPMDLYASANVTYVEEVLATGVGDPTSQATYAYGRVTVWSREDAWRDWDSLEALAEDEVAGTIAIANPEHAPYGLAAKQALTSAGVWEDVEPRLVYGENIADTQRLASTGNADVAIVALSLALAAEEDGEGAWTLLPAELHEPLQQDLLVVADEEDRAGLAERFIAHVSSEDGREVMRRYGFLLPGEEPPEAWRD